MLSQIDAPEKATTAFTIMGIEKLPVLKDAGQIAGDQPMSIAILGYNKKAIIFKEQTKLLSKLS